MTVIALSVAAFWGLCLVAVVCVFAWESWDEHMWVRDQNRCLALLLEMERTESVIVRDWEE
jgi:hypothetical protein